MDKRDRKRIGLLLEYRQKWLGGVYYILNIIKAVNLLDDEVKPIFVIFYDSESEQFLDQIDYPYLQKIETSFDNKYADYLKAWTTRKDKYLDKLTGANQLDGLFPMNDLPVKTKNLKTKLVSWFPDLQHKFFPRYFTKKNLLLREYRLKLLLKNGNSLVVSSEDTKKEFEKFYSLKSSFKFSVLPFVSMVQDFDLPELDELLDKYKLPEKFFVVSNQFYEHKNHKLVLQAINNLKETIDDLLVIFTGRMEDHRNPQHIETLKQTLLENKLEKHALFVGLIPRRDQLCLLKNSVAVIQPSKFEGWSTVVEDTKALQAQIIVSDIAVHLEQLGEKGHFFSRDDVHDLSDKMSSCWNDQVPSHGIFERYDEHIHIFGEKFLAIFN